jgi:ABC-type Fe3+ transport system permease subunit
MEHIKELAMTVEAAFWGLFSALVSTGIATALGFILAIFLTGLELQPRLKELSSIDNC